MGIVAPNSVPAWDPNNKELKKFNWGAFGWGWLWGLSNGCLRKVIGLDIASIVLNMVPYIGWIGALGIKIYLGLHGNEWAYNGRVWYNVKDFHDTQKRWAKFVAACACLMVLVYILAGAFVALGAVLSNNAIGKIDSPDYNYSKSTNKLSKERREELETIKNKAREENTLKLLSYETVDIIIKIEKQKPLKTSEEVVDSLIEYKQKQDSDFYEYKKLSPKAYAVYKNGSDSDKMDEVYIFTKEENCSLERQNCRIYYYKNVAPGDKPKPEMVICYDSKGETKKLKTASN